MARIKEWNETVVIQHSRVLCDRCGAEAPYRGRQAVERWRERPWFCKACGGNRPDECHDTLGRSWWVYLQVELKHRPMREVAEEAHISRSYGHGILRDRRMRFSHWSQRALAKGRTMALAGYIDDMLQYAAGWSFNRFPPTDFKRPSLKEVFAET